MNAEQRYALISVVMALLAVAAGADGDTFARLGLGFLSLGYAVGMLVLSANRERKAYYDDDKNDDDEEVEHDDTRDRT